MRILLAEDDELLGSGIRAGLAQHGFQVDWVRDGVAAERELATGAYQACVLDLGLPRQDGMDVLRQVRSRRNATPVLVLTARDAVTARIAGLDAGADDYLVKPFDAEELLARLRAVERRRSGTDSAVLELPGLVIDLGRTTVLADGQVAELTAKEWALLRVLALRPDRIHRRESLQDALYGLDADTSSNTLEVFISNLRRKIGRERIQTLRGLGYKLNTSP